MRRVFAVTLPCLFLMLVGCGTTPNPRFYALTGPRRPRRPPPSCRWPWGR